MPSNRDELKKIYDKYREVYMNEKYYAHRLTTFSKWNDIYEGTLAIGASGTIASWPFFQKSEIGKNIWIIFGGVIAVLVVLKPFFKLAQKVESRSKLYIGYRDLRFDLEQLVDDIQANGFNITQEIKNTFIAANKRYKSLGLEDEINPVKKLVDKYFEEVNSEIPSFSIWSPQAQDQSATIA